MATGFFFALAICLIFWSALTVSSYLPTIPKGGPTLEFRATTPFAPQTGATWQISLSQVVDPSNVSDAYTIYDVDLFDTSATTISSLKAKGHNVICYFSAGSYENWRPDASSFPTAAIGNALDGWEGENWVDTRNAGLRDVMAKRIQLAQQKGCDGVDPDNIDGYGNDSGFPLTKATGTDYVKFLASTSHGLGLACGLKNGGDIVGSVIGDVEWELNEQCVVYSECDSLQPFIEAGKPVFHIEYTESNSPSAAFLEKPCSGAGTTGFSTLIKHMALGLWTATCP